MSETGERLDEEVKSATPHDAAALRRILAERVLRLVSLAPLGIYVTNVLLADKALCGPLAKLPPEAVVALIREMLENHYLEYVPGSTRLALAPGYRHFQQAI